MRTDKFGIISFNIYRWNQENYLQKRGECDAINTTTIRLRHLLENPQCRVYVPAVNASLHDRVHHDRIQLPMPPLRAIYLPKDLQRKTNKEEEEEEEEGKSRQIHGKNLKKNPEKQKEKENRSWGEEEFDLKNLMELPSSSEIDDTSGEFSEIGFVRGVLGRRGEEREGDAEGVWEEQEEIWKENFGGWISVSREGEKIWSCIALVISSIKWIEKEQEIKTAREGNRKSRSGFLISDVVLNPWRVSPKLLL